MTNEEFEQWYVENAFDYVSNPIGSRDCGLQRKAWNASREAVEGPQIAIFIALSDKFDKYQEDAEGKLKELQAENTRLKEELAKPYDLRVSQLQYDLGNILACTHRDGGHYQIEHGTKKAATDAVAIICEWRNAFDELAETKIFSKIVFDQLQALQEEVAAMREQEPARPAFTNDGDGAKSETDKESLTRMEVEI